MISPSLLALVLVVVIYFYIVLAIKFRLPTDCIRASSFMLNLDLYFFYFQSFFFLILIIFAIIVKITQTRLFADAFFSDYLVMEIVQNKQQIIDFLFLQHAELQATLQKELGENSFTGLKIVSSDSYFSILDQKIEQLKQTNLQLESKGDVLFSRIKQVLPFPVSHQESGLKLENQADPKVTAPSPIEDKSAEKQN